MFDSSLHPAVWLMLILTALGLILGALVVFWLRQRLRALRQDLATLQTESRRQRRATAKCQVALDNLTKELEHATGLVGLAGVQLADLRSALTTQPGTVT